MNNRTRATDIPMSVKKKVWERDNHCCVVCGWNQNVMPNSHILRRSKGGRGIETNVVTMCTDLTPNKCHSRYDNGTKEDHERIYYIVEQYMKSKYPNWNIENQRYKKRP